MLYSNIKIAAAAVLLLLCQACTLTIPVDEPSPSLTPYQSDSTEAGETATTMPVAFKSSLSADHSTASGMSAIKLQHDGNPLDGSSFFIENLQQELLARGLPVEVRDSADGVVDLQAIEVFSHRSNGFSPMVTLSSVSVDSHTPDFSEPQRITSFVKRGEVPVWSMTEINEPCYNEPTELLVKEVAAKINMTAFGYALSDEQVEGLAKAVRDQSNGGLAYLDVYELAFSNNSKAAPYLLEFVDHKEDYIRLAAISGLGILKVTDQIELLKSIYTNADLWQDRGMALKAIGDLQTAESLAYLREQRQRWKARASKEARWNSKIIDLYLN